jgi:hypothetical protein
VIDIKSEIARDQDERQAEMEAAEAAEKENEPYKNGDGE